MRIDFQTIELEGGADHTHLIAAGVEKRQLDRYVDMLAEFGIKPDRIVFSGYAAAACLARAEYFPEKGLFLDLTEKRGILFIISARQIPQRSNW